MTIDVSELEVRADQHREFIEVFEKAWDHLSNLPGLIQWKLNYRQGRPNRFVFCGEWVDREAHAAMCCSREYREYLRQIAPFLVRPPQVLEEAVA